MSVKRFLETGGGNFATVKNTPEGSQYPILQVYFDNEPYKDNPAIVVNSMKDGAEFKIRLLRQNVARIAETLSDDESKWIGHNLRCTTHVHYPGLGKDGIVWNGVKAGQQTQMPTAPKPNLVANTLSTETMQWLMVSQSDIGQVLDGPTWSNIVQRGISKELDRYGLINFIDGQPVLSEKCRDYL